MLMTENEAKDKTCPAATTPEEFVFCGASSCMAWRWVPIDLADEAFVEAQATRMKETGEKAKDAIAYVRSHRAEFGLPEAPYQGWCGMAGKPDDAPKVYR